MHLVLGDWPESNARGKTRLRKRNLVEGCCVSAVIFPCSPGGIFPCYAAEIPTAIQQEEFK